MPRSKSEAGLLPAWPQRARWSAGELALLGLLLALALALRAVGLEQTPPGMQHDEVFNARFATNILNGERPVFIDENTGVMPLYAYLAAGAFALLGRSLLALRLTSVAVSVAGLLVSYLVLRELAGRRVALLTLAGLTVSFWHLFDSRVGIEPIIVTLTTSLSFYLFWGALRRGSLTWYALAGVSMGAAQYGHRTGPLIPLTAAVFVVYLLIARHPWLQGQGQRISRQGAVLGVSLMFLIAGILVAPLITHVLTQPAESMLRVRQLSQDLQSLWAGDPRPVVQDMLGVLGMFGLRGDPEWRYNVAGRPIFDPATGALFWVGVALCLARLRCPTNLFLLLWVPVNLVMAAVTPPSPASTRALGAIAPIYAMPAIALVRAWDEAAKQRGWGWRAGVGGATALLLLGNAAWTGYDYFQVWPANAEVRAIYRADLAQAARYLDQTQPAGVVCISAQFAADLDQQTFDYILKRSRPLKWFDGRQALIIPTTPADQPVIYLFPATNPPSPAIESWLGQAGAAVERLLDRDGRVALHVYRLEPAQMGRLRQVRPAVSLKVNLGNEIDLLGYDLPIEQRAGDPIPLLVYWRVRRGGRGDLMYAFFAHLLDERGRRWAQDDPTGFPSHSWWAGDLVIQFFDVRAPVDAPPGAYHFDLGVYEKNSGRRLAQADGADSLMLQPLTLLSAARAPAEGELSISERLDVVFAGRLRLLGYHIDTRILDLEGHTEVALFWQAAGADLPDVAMELFLTDEGGTTLPARRRELLEGDYPLGEWEAGGVVRDRFDLVHNAEIPRGLYTLELALVERSSGRPLMTEEGRSRVSLGQVFLRGLK